MNRPRLIAILSILVMLVGLSACGSNKKKELKPNKLGDFDERVEFKKQWSKSIGSGLGKYYQQFVLAQDDQFVYAASYNGKVYQLDKKTGKVGWKVSIDNTLTAGVAVDDKQVYVGTLDGAIVAINKKDGEQNWSEQLISEAVSAPSSNNRSVVVQTINGQVYSLDTVDGEIKWRYDSVPSSLTVRGNSRPYFFSSYIVVGLGNGKLAVLSSENGQLMWEPKVAEPKGDTELGRVVDVDATPFVLDGKLIAASYQGKIVAYDLKSGQLRWSADESTFRDVGSAADAVYVSSVDAVITAYDSGSGDVKWANDDLLRRKVSGPVSIGEYLIVGDFEGYLHIVGRQDGQIVGRKKLNGSGIKSSVMIGDDWIYAIANNGKLVAYKLQDR